ncbi:ral guanine nucleotide dissociation stimulator-like isoform X3 [Equus caballus]|uniref:ral guanine nucleotide dissociation stimulator-like isoform X3 n=1 Tax=Equus caballus TaxID=9796 RepID=UPI0038B269E3
MGVSPYGDVQQAPDASWPVCRALSSQNSTQEIFEELCVGFDFSPSLVKEQEQQATSSILCRSEEPTLSVAEARTMLTLKAGAVQKVVGCLQPSFHGRSISVTTFPCVYQAFYPTPQVLDQLLQSALSPIWGPRPQENSQDMWQMLRHSRINLTLAYLQDLLPGSVLKHQATPLLIQVDLFQATELETEAPAPAPALLPGAEVEKGPHLELDGTPVLFLPSLLALEPAAAPSAAPDPERVPSAAPAQVPGPELDSTGPRGLLGFPPQAPVTAAESAPVPEASHPCRVTGKKQPDGKPSLMAFSPRDVAEQLTAIDAKQPSKFATLLRTLQRGRKRQQQKGNEINHEKKKKEHSVMIEIVQLQEAAENYNLEPQELFRSWFWDMEQLSEDERMVTSRMEIVLLVTIGPTLADVSLMVIRKLNMGLGTTCCSGMKTQGTFFLPRAGEAVAGFEQQNHTFGYCCWCSNAVPWDMESNSTSAQPERGCSSLGCWKCALAARAAGTASTRLQQSPLCCLIACSPRWVICPHGTEDCLHPAPKRDSIFLRGQGFDFP